MHVVHNYQTCNNNDNWTVVWIVVQIETHRYKGAFRTTDWQLYAQKARHRCASISVVSSLARTRCVYTTNAPSLTLCCPHTRTHTHKYANKFTCSCKRASTHTHWRLWCTYNIIDTPVGLQRERTHTHMQFVWVSKRMLLLSEVHVQAICARVLAVCLGTSMCVRDSGAENGAHRTCVCVCACGGRAHARIEKVESQSSVRERVAPHAIGPLSLICACVSSARRNRRANTKWLWMRAACWFGGEFNMCMGMYACVCVYVLWCARTYTVWGMIHSWLETEHMICWKIGAIFLVNFKNTCGIYSFTNIIYNCL